MKIHVIGHPEAVQGFALVGILGEPATNAEEANSALDHAMEINEVGIILVTDDVAAMIEERINELKYQSEIPLVVEIPGPNSTANQQESLNKMIEHAIGIKF